MNRKGQGALEFLMTYGWAFLVILIMIGALAYFGILNPRQFLPDRCSFGSEIQCRDTWTNGTHVSLKLTNSIGYTVNVTNIKFGNSDGMTCASYNTSVGDLTTTIWKEGESIDFFGYGCTGGGIDSATGDKYKFDTDITWYDTKSTPAYSHTTKGEVFRVIE